MSLSERRLPGPPPPSSNSVAQSCPTLCDPMNIRIPCPSPTPRACSNSCPLSRQCHPTISSSVVPFSSRLQSSPASGSFQMSQFFASGGQSTRVSAPALVLPMNFRTDFLRMDWLDLLLVQGILKHLLQHQSAKTSILQHSAFFMVQLSHPYMTTRKTIALARWTFVSKVTFYPNLSQILFGVVTISCVVLMKRTPFHYRSHGGQIFSFDVACISTWQINAFT